MVRGLFQNAVIVNNPAGGKVFRQAIFILRSEGGPFSDRELEEEAQRIIEESTGTRKRRRVYK